MFNMGFPPNVVNRLTKVSPSKTFHLGRHTAQEHY
jgi:hypothetical protein